MMLATLCSIAWLSALPFCAEDRTPGYAGYVEGESVLIAPREAGRIVEVNVERGTTIAAGTLLFRIEDRDAADALKVAEAELARLEAERADLQTGKRPEEIAVTKAQLAEAEAAEREARRDFERQVKLRDEKVIAPARLDQVKSVLERAEAQVTTLRRQIDVQSMAARSDAIAAALSRIDAQKSNVAQARWRLEQRRVRAPVAGLVEDVLRRAGEMAAPDAAVIALLPPQNRIVRFFVPEAERARFVPGKHVALACDGCSEGLGATIAFVAPQPEYTPPVIYSVESRQKLVYLVEARPEGEALSLAPGQVVDVRLLPDASS